MELERGRELSVVSTRKGMVELAVGSSRKGI